MTLDAARIYLRQYEHIAQSIRQPFDPASGEADCVPSHLADRAAIETEGFPELREELAASDHALADALQSPAEGWPERMEHWAAQLGFADSPWWLRIVVPSSRG